MTSKAWTEKVLQKLIQKEESILIKNNQCCFGLRDLDGGLLKKSTGWITNSKWIAQHLDRQCPGDHQRIPVLGSCQGTSRSKQSQEYPPALVKAILRGFCQEVKEHARTHPEEITWLDLRDCKDFNNRIQQKENLWIWFSTNILKEETDHQEGEKEAETENEEKANNFFLENDPFRLSN